VEGVFCSYLTENPIPVINFHKKQIQYELVTLFCGQTYNLPQNDSTKLKKKVDLIPLFNTFSV